VKKLLTKLFRKWGFVQTTEIEELKQLLKESQELSSKEQKLLDQKLENLIPTAQSAIQDEYQAVLLGAKNNLNTEIEKTLAGIRTDNTKLEKRVIEPIEQETKTNTKKLSEVQNQTNRIEKQLVEENKELRKELAEIKINLEANKQSIVATETKIKNPFYINNLPVNIAKNTNVYASDIKLAKTNGQNVLFVVKTMDERLFYIEQKIKEILERQGLSEKESEELKQITDEVIELKNFRDETTQKIEKLTHPIVKRRFTQASVKEFAENVKK